MTVNQLRRKMNRRGHGQLKLSRLMPCIIRDAAGNPLALGVRDAYLHPTKGFRVGTMLRGFRGAI